MQNNVPQPLFAPAGLSGAQTDDIDFNEIFAEYFINEFDDPLNAYTSSMANYSSVSVPMKQETDFPAPPVSMAPEVQLSLPTGGIRTAFHTGAARYAPAQAAPVPVAKKPKIMEMQPVEAPAPVPALATIPMQPLSHPGMQVLSHPGPFLAAQQLQQNHAAAVLAATQQLQSQTAADNSAARVSLPVGVGIRLGGVGGIAPATAQASARAPGAPDHYSIWGEMAGGMPDQLAADRRQRNREHAKRSRVRKKFMLESLQEQVLDLQKENQRLRLIVQEHVPEKAMQIIADICSEHPLFTDTDDRESDNKEKEKEPMVRADYTLMRSLATGQKCFVLSDPKLPDNPIVFASPDFYKLTGYTSKEVLGRNCRFLQGPGTDTKAVEIIRKAIATGSDATVCLLNYKADGKPFWNQFFIAALRDSDNCIVNFVGVQTEVEPNTGSSALEDKVNAVLPLQTKDDRSSEQPSEW